MTTFHCTLSGPAIVDPASRESKTKKIIALVPKYLSTEFTIVRDQYAHKSLSRCRCSGEISILSNEFEEKRRNVSFIIRIAQKRSANGDVESAGARETMLPG